MQREIQQGRGGSEDVKPNERRKLKPEKGYDQQKHYKSATHTRGGALSCRRYWTLGGNLRNVSVRGDCRRGKRSKRLSLLVLVRINRLSHSYSHNHNLSNITWLPLRSFKFCFEGKRIKEFGLTSSWDVFDGILEDKTHPIGPSRNYGLCFNGLMATWLLNMLWTWTISRHLPLYKKGSLLHCTIFKNSNNRNKQIRSHLPSPPFSLSA
jgi:hypothetical protein